MYDTETITTAAVGLGLLAAGLFNGWQTVQAKREAKRAAQNSHPISNGWGTALRSDMAALRSAVERIDRRQTTADERDERLAREVQTASDHARTAAEQSASVATGLAAHLADHASNDAREAHTS